MIPKVIKMAKSVKDAEWLAHRRPGPPAKLIAAGRQAPPGRRAWRGAGPPPIAVPSIFTHSDTSRNVENAYANSASSLQPQGKQERLAAQGDYRRPLAPRA